MTPTPTEPQPLTDEELAFVRRVAEATPSGHDFSFNNNSVCKLLNHIDSLRSQVAALTAHDADPKHYERALDSIASHLCSTDLTDGFCGPRGGKCVGGQGERPDRRNCIVRARGCIEAMRSRGVKPLWTYDKGPAPPSASEGTGAKG